jgi:hypothetical protein
VIETGIGRPLKTFAVLATTDCLPSSHVVGTVPPPPPPVLTLTLVLSEALVWPFDAVTLTLPLDVGEVVHVACEPVHRPVHDHAVGVKLQLTENVCESPSCTVGFDGLMLHDALPAPTVFEAVPPAAPVTVIVFAWLSRQVEPLELSQPVQPVIESAAPAAVRQLPVYVD